MFICLSIFDIAYSAPNNELILWLSSGNQKQLDKALRMLYEESGKEFQGIKRDDSLKLAWALWNEDREKYSTFNWSLISNNRFRIELANLLGQWLRYSRNSPRESLLQIKQYVIQQRNSPDLEVKRTAMLYPVYPDSCDLRFLVSEALREDGIISATAVFAITGILGPKGKEPLQEIRSKIKSPNLIKQIDRQMNPNNQMFRIQDVEDFLERDDCKQPT
jgi:hypothetical protein